MSARRCPSELELDAFFLAGQPEADGLRAHVAGCPRCQARLRERGEARELFLREVYPATVAAVEAAVRPARAGAGIWRWPWRPAALAAAACLALVLVVGGVLWLRAPGAGLVPGGYVGLKGGAGLLVYARRGDQVFEVQPGDVLRAGDRLRFVPRLPGPGYLMILSVDARGRVRLFHPQAGTRAAAVRPPTGAVALPGSIELEESEGPERLWLLFSPEEFDVAAVEAAVAEGLRASGAVEDLSVLPIDLEQVSLPVHKE